MWQNQRSVDIVYTYRLGINSSLIWWRGGELIWTLLCCLEVFRAIYSIHMPILVQWTLLPRLGINWALNLTGIIVIFMSPCFFVKLGPSEALLTCNGQMRATQTVAKSCQTHIVYLYLCQYLNYARIITESSTDFTFDLHDTNPSSCYYCYYCRCCCCC